MVKIATLLLISFSLITQDFEKDLYETEAGTLEITFIGHGSLLFTIDEKTLYIDPSSREADYSHFPKADFIVITHHHGDHCDAKAVDAIVTEQTRIVTTALASEKLGKGEILNNNEQTKLGDIRVEAIPAYNLMHKRDNGDFFHVKGECNSYVITMGDMRIFIGGDTENTPEMKALKNIDVAFLPMNLPYTMTPEMVADAAKSFRPSILYPYHYGKTDISEISALMKDDTDIKLVIRSME